MKISRLIGVFCLVASFHAGANEASLDRMAPYMEGFCKEMGGALSVARADTDGYLATCTTPGQALFTVDAWRIDPTTVRASMRIPAAIARKLATEFEMAREPLKEPPSPIFGDVWSLLDVICSDYGGAWREREKSAWTRLGSCVDDYTNRTVHILSMDLESDFVIVTSSTDFAKSPLPVRGLSFLSA